MDILGLVPFRPEFFRTGILYQLRSVSSYSQLFKVITLEKCCLTILDFNRNQRLRDKKAGKMLKLSISSTRVRSEVQSTSWTSFENLKQKIAKFLKKC